jgi:hypothetical protein
MNLLYVMLKKVDRLCGLVAELLATDPEVRVWNGSTQPREYN